MDVVIYIPTLEVFGEEIPLTIGVATFDLMGNERPTAFEIPSLHPSLTTTLQRTIAGAERVWLGPNLNAAFTLCDSLRHPQLRDAETLLSLVPHMPAEYFRGASPGLNAMTLVERLRSCVSALLCAGL